MSKLIDVFFMYALLTVSGGAIISLIVWVAAHAAKAPSAANAGKIGFFICLGVAALLGMVTLILNFMYNLGRS